MSINYPIKIKLISVYRFEIDSYFSMLNTNYTNLLKLRTITGQLDENLKAANALTSGEMLEIYSVYNNKEISLHLISTFKDVVID